ncbi:MAG: alpha-2-macroglobulin family protein, partial [Pseudothermotoga sp.]|nr:alpha-2-macroglobulin family protein [Pseudothermotoga sp.]
DGTLTVEVDGAVQEIQVTNGKAEFTFVPEKPKTYNVELSFGKAKKRLIIHAFGEGYKPSELMLICDQKKLQPGQTFQLQLVSSYRFTGLVAVLAERIYQIVPVDAFERASILLKAPEDVFEKNLFIVFLGIENGRRVEKELKIPVERALNVSSLKISFDKAKYEPGEFATVKIEADAASVCLMLVDEAIYAMIGQEPPSLEEFLYPENDYPAVTYDFAHTWRLYSSTDRVYAELLSKEVSFEDFKKSAVTEKINVREYFPDTALWIPSLRLERGVATLRFKVPDSITTFRATAYGFSKSMFSQGSGSMLVTKPFYVRPNLPTFFREGDVVRVGATIFNRTDEALKVNYWVEFPNALRAMQDVSGETVVQPNSSFTQSYFVEAIQPSDPSTMTFYAVSKRTDAVALNVPVRPFAFEREYYSLEVIDAKKNVTLPDAEYVQAKLRVLKSVVPVLAKSIEGLIHYPYGCTEQTMSSFLPAIVASKMGLKIENLDEIVQKGLFRLYDHQHSDGGWGWWKTDESHPLMSAYVMEGLYYAREAGYHVPDSVVRRGMEYLSNNLTGYGAYVLSLHGVNAVDFQPKNAIDLIFGSMLSAEYLRRALEFVEENERFARVRVDFDDHFISEIQLSSVLLRSL